MNKDAGQPSPSVLREIADLVVESRIRIDALEQILVKTNTVAYELYLDTIERMQPQKQAEVKRVLAQTHRKKRTGR
jgi:hypothetical protein